jgi:putative copper export protein
MITTWLIVTRALHLGACLLFFGIFAFDRLVATAVTTDTRATPTGYRRIKAGSFILLLLALILFSGILWLAGVAMTMSGQPLGFGILKTVWSQTQFGTVWQLRLCVWLAAAIIAALSCSLKRFAALRSIMVWMQLLQSGVLLGSLAWAGHGSETSGWHLFADVLHLLVAGLWPVGLLPFLLLLQNLRRTTEPPSMNDIAALVRRFSAVSLASVALLSLTGLANSWFLVGSFANLFQQAYGRWLLLKIILFLAAVALGAINLLRLKPRLATETRETQKYESACRQLLVNVQAELFLGVIILVVVAVLGILPPANH